MRFSMSNASWPLLLATVAIIVLAGCHQDGILVEYHLPAKLTTFTILADSEYGQDISDVNGVVQIKLDNTGLARVESFGFQERWHSTAIFMAGQRVDVTKFESQVKQAKIKTRNPDGSVSSRSIKNGSSVIIELAYTTP